MFIGGVAFSICHAIIPENEAMNIKPLAEVGLLHPSFLSIDVLPLTDLLHLPLLGVDHLDSLLHRGHRSPSEETPRRQGPREQVRAEYQLDTDCLQACTAAQRRFQRASATIASNVGSQPAHLRRFGRCTVG